MNYCLALKLTWILFHHVYALKDESNNVLNGSSVGIGKTTNRHGNLSILKSNFSTLEYVFTSVNVTPKVSYGKVNINLICQSKLTASNVTVIFEGVLTTKLPNSTKQLDKLLSEKTTEVRHITTGTNAIQEEVTEIDEFGKSELGESSIHSSDSYVEPRKKDSEGVGPQIDPENYIFNRKHFAESESKKSNGFIYQSDSGTVVRDKLCKFMFLCIK
ncbi:unnamed protein product [Schistosoma rodhaini]|uniref:Uncharacterized protein n=1 Tax=Schistosoma rodhaini TaxID=6188 RepID=A0AA85GEE6_9TREM|nr:unnamed protein product [Schistosoma rodhaini]CAH8639797.1 unnamed protein product [Schistosoma rodhaini]